MYWFFVVLSSIFMFIFFLRWITKHGRKLPEEETRSDRIDNDFWGMAVSFIILFISVLASLIPR